MMQNASMLARHAAPFVGFAPPLQNLSTLGRVWHRRESGVLTTDFGDAALVYGEPLGAESYKLVEKSLYTSFAMSFRPEHPGRAAAPPVLMAVLWDAAGRVARPKELNPKVTLAVSEPLRRDLPLDELTWQFLGDKEVIPLKPLIRAKKDQRAAVIRDLARLIACDFVTVEPEEVVEAEPEVSPLDEAIALIDAGQFTEGIARLVAMSTPDARAWMGYAIYSDPNRPEVHRRTSGRMLLKMARAEGSAAATHLLNTLGI